MIIYHAMREPYLMTDEERADLIAQGWQPEVIHSLHQRGFRPCAVDHIEARFNGADPSASCGFLRQSCTPHLFITLTRDTILEVVIEHIDSAIYQAGYKDGHERLAGDFMRFFSACKNHRLPPDVAAIEARLSRMEALAND